MCFYKGSGTAKDLAAARDWSEKSADQGFEHAQTMLGTMMAKGEGGEWKCITRSQGIAINSEKGDVDATEMLEDICKYIDTSWNHDLS